jgi:pimeloyl-ACP methyl ester carboxylesterase
VLDAYGIPCAHVVGVSAGGAFAQLLALEFPDRVRSLVLISTSAATPGDRELPTPTDQFRRFVSAATVDWSDRDSVVDYVVGYSRMLAGDQRPFDEAQMRDLVRHDLERARDFAARRNHDLLTEGESPSAPLSSITAPTLVIHGTADPMFPVAHGEALAHEISDARLLRLDGAGHGIDPADRETIAAAIIDHTVAPGERESYWLPGARTQR